MHLPFIDHDPVLCSRSPIYLSASYPSTFSVLPELLASFSFAATCSREYLRPCYTFARLCRTSGFLYLHFFHLRLLFLRLSFLVASSSTNSSLSSTELFFRVRPSLSLKSIFYYLIRIFPVPGATSLFGGLCLHLSLTLLFLSILVRRPPSRWFCTVFSLLLSFARQIRIFVRIILLLVVPSSFPKQPVCVLSPVRVAPPLRSSELFTPFPPFPRLTERKRC